jgi:hypothetical protein
LRAVAIGGVEEPENPRGRWRIPRAKLTDVVAACLYRRQRRSHDRVAVDLSSCLLDAAEAMLADPELAGLVPKRLRRLAVERRQARWRAQQERQRRIAEAERRRAEEREAARRREREEERLSHERLERGRRREEHERVLGACYRICYRAAFRSLNLPWGDKRGLPAYEQLRRDFPYDRLGWWQPPPGFYEAVAEDLPKQVEFGYVEPDWSRWVPPYEPGKPWPWRKREGAGDAGDC